MAEQQTYVQLGGDDEDELGSNLSVDSAVRSRSKTPYSPFGGKTNGKTNSAFANPHSTANVFSASGTLVHEEIVANWEVYCSYKSILCVILLLFSMASVSSGEAFRAWEKKNDSKICSNSPIGADTKETNLFGNFSVAALFITLVVCIWCFFSYIKMRAVYKNPNINVTIKNIQHEKKLKRIDIIGIIIGFIVLTVGISILGTDISSDIMNVSTDCDDTQYLFDGTRAISIAKAFNILHICYWMAILLAIIYITTTKYYCLRGQNKGKWIERVNSKC
eukprot:UN01224